jgi:PKD repeat protein
MRMLALMWALLLAVAVVVLGGCGGGEADEAPAPFPVLIGGGGGDAPPDGNNLPPAAAIATSQLVGTGLSVTFNGTASADSDGLITDYRWTFGDGDTAQIPLVSHLYATPGSYVVTLTVTDDDGASDTASITVSIGGGLAVNLTPGAAFTPTPRNGVAPLSVVFDASLSADSDGLVVDYRWSFGDGDIGAGLIVSHTYTGAGIYPVRLTVTDDDGARSTATQTIVVASASDAAGTSGGTGTLSAGPLTTGSVGADARAVHRLALRAGEPVVLTFPVERIAATDLDLYLFDLADPQRPALAASSVGLGDTESVTAPAAGTYALLVEAVGAGTDYRLRVGGEPPAPAPALTEGFVAGELLLQRHPGNGAPVPLELTPVDQLPDGGILVRLPPAADTADPYWAGQPLQAHYLTMRRFKQLGLDPAFAAVELDRNGAAIPTDR